MITAFTLQTSKTALFRLKSSTATACLKAPQSFKRLAQGKITLKDLGLDHQPKPGENLAKPIFDVSTKLEETDRYVTWSEAQKIAGLTNQELADVKDGSA